MLNMKCIDFDIQHSTRLRQGSVGQAFNIQYFLVLRHSDGGATQLKIVVVNILSRPYR
jgi:hypothetical protein